MRTVTKRIVILILSLILTLLLGLTYLSDNQGKNFFIGTWSETTGDLVLDDIKGSNLDKIYIFKDKTALIDGIIKSTCIWDMKTDEMVIMNCKLSNDSYVVILRKISSSSVSVSNSTNNFIKVN